MHISTRLYSWSRLLISLLLLFFVFLNIAQAKPTPLELNQNNEEQSLNGHIEVLFDHTSSLSFETAMSHLEWIDIGEQPFSKGLNTEVAWLRFSIFNPEALPLERIFQCNNTQAQQQ